MPFPDYKDIMDERERRRKQENEGGRQRVLKNMAEGLCERLRSDYHLSEADIHTDFGDPDIRKWKVLVTMEGNTPPIQESFWEFPSQQMLATLMMLGKIKK